MNKDNHNHIGFILILIFFLVFLELISYLSALYISTRGKFLYIPQINESYNTYILRVNQYYGWPSSFTTPKGAVSDELIKGFRFDESGSRVIPAFPGPQKACVSLYGDSFAYSGGVDDQHAWSNVLSILLGCKVANFGFTGYGTDQAYLRFHHNDNDNAKVVILSHFSENIQRNVNQLRNLLFPSPQFMIKPRFILDDERRLKLIPVPSLSEKDYYDCIKNPELYLKHDFFIPGGKSGLIKAKFPYTLTIFKVTKALIYERFFLGILNYQKLYDPQHPSQGLQVTIAIMKQFYGECQEKGKYPLIVIIPVHHDIFQYYKDNYWNYQPLLDELERNKIEYINIGQGMVDYLQGGDPWRLYSKETLHCNEEGYELIAKIVFRYIKDHRIDKFIKSN
jgi:hypothetical protein